VDSSEKIYIMFGMDCSGSMFQYRQVVSQCLEKLKQSLCELNGYEILIARSDFSDDVKFGEYDEVEMLDTSYESGGFTTLYDCIVSNGKLMINQMNDNQDAKYLFIIFSDGFENGSLIGTVESAKDTIEKLHNGGVMTAFISFGEEAQIESQNTGFGNLLVVDRTETELKKAFDYLAKSIIEYIETYKSGNTFFVTI